MMGVPKKTIARKIRKYLWQNKNEKKIYQDLLHAVEAAQCS